jgi:hypothetical protein
MVVSGMFPASLAGAAENSLIELSATAAVTAIRRGDIKAEEYARVLLERAQQLASLNAFRSLDREAVLEAARDADRRRASGAQLGMLQGLPIPVKDSVNTRALPTSNGTRALANFKPKDDAAVLKPLFAQGAILMGKTNLHELSFGWTSNNAVFGPVRNPYDPSRVPGRPQPYQPRIGKSERRHSHRGDRGEAAAGGVARASMRLHTSEWRRFLFGRSTGKTAVPESLPQKCPAELNVSGPLGHFRSVLVAA